VQFKKFGVQLNFTPTVTASGAIYLKVKPEVSALDFTNAVTIDGFLIPALSSRVAETEIVLKDGESFAIAGLIDNRVTQVMTKIMILGDIPIVGHAALRQTDSGGRGIETAHNRRTLSVAPGPAEERQGQGRRGPGLRPGQYQTAVRRTARVCIAEAAAIAV
jgi:hypothetical protein